MKTLSPTDLKRKIEGKKILIDTNIIIYLTEKIQPYEELSRLLFEMLETGTVKGILSVVTVGEIMQGLLKKGQTDTALAIKDYLFNFPNIKCQTIDENVMEQIGRDNRVDWTRLRTLDSLIIASSLANRIDIIVSNDRHFQKAVPKDMLVSFDSF